MTADERKELRLLCDLAGPLGAEQAFNLRTRVHEALDQVDACDKLIADLEQRLSIATELNAIDGKRRRELEIGLREACARIARLSTDESVLLKRLRKLAGE